MFVLVMQDRMTADDGRLAFLGLVTHPEFEPTIPVLVDIRRVIEITADFKGVFMTVQALKAKMAALDCQTRFVVMTGEGASFGMARMLQQVVEVITQLRMTVVATSAEACAILGIPEPIMEAVVAGDFVALPERLVE